MDQAVFPYDPLGILAKSEFSGSVVWTGLDLGLPSDHPLPRFIDVMTSALTKRTMPHNHHYYYAPFNLTI